MIVEWLLILSVCDLEKCISQTVDRYHNETACLIGKADYQKVPEDGVWKSINYICKPANSEKI